MDPLCLTFTLWKVTRRKVQGDLYTASSRTRRQTTPPDLRQRKQEDDGGGRSESAEEQMKPEAIHHQLGGSETWVAGKSVIKAIKIVV